jgi:hypothetical protein
MALLSGTSDNATDFWDSLERLQLRIEKSTAVNVGTASLRTETRAFVKDYFGVVRPNWEELEVARAHVDVADEACQELNKLANGANKRSSYRKQLKILRSLRPAVEVDLARIGARPKPEVRHNSDIEDKILATLGSLLPSAALSYQQVLIDLRESRVSYRGTAVELRELLREVLDQLAPDAEVAGEPGFKLEPNTTKPTQRQKALFVLKARALPRNAMKPTENAIEMAEEISARMARSVYEKSSVSTHVMTNKHEIARIKMFIDGVLVELLQISLE